MSEKKTTKAQRLQSAAQEVIDAVNAAREAFSALEDAVSEVNDRMNDLESTRADEYESWRDNLPESLQESPVGQKLNDLLDIDLDYSIEVEEPSFDDIESAAQEILDADLPQGFGRD
jgi:hypothetical protein